MFMLMKLPSAFFCGVRLRQISTESTVVSVPFKWLSQNPFRSIYFACQAMAAEMSTGLLALGNVYRRNPQVSMLVTGIHAVFHKKADRRIFFTCSDGAGFKRMIDEAIATGEGVKFSAKSIGKTADGELVSEFTIEWSFRVRKK